MAMAFMAIYLVDQRGASGQMFGAIYVAASLLQSVTQGWSGNLSDRIGRTRLMATALIARSVVFAALGTAVLADSPIWLVAGTIIVSSMLRGGFEPVAFAVVADVARPEQRVNAFGLQRMGINLGWAIGPAFGGLLAKLIGYGFVFYLSAPLTFATGLAVLRIADPVSSRAARVVRAARSNGERLRVRPELALALACAFLASLVHVQLFSTLSVYCKGVLDLGEGAIGAVYTVNGVAVLLLQMPAVALIARGGAARALVAGPLCYAVGFFGVGLAGGWSGVALSILFITFGEVLLAPAQQATMAELGDPARMGRAFGLLGTMQMLGVAMSPLLGGLNYDHLRDRPILMWGLVAAAAVVLAGCYAAFAAQRARLAAARAPAGSAVA
jgi:MFS family permease